MPFISQSSGLQPANNLSDVSNASTARTNLGLAIGINVQAQDVELSAIAGLTSAADSFPYFTGSGAASLFLMNGATRTAIGGLSGTNTGDAATNSTSNTYADGKVSDSVYGAGWDSVTTIAPSKNAVYDKIETLLSIGAAASTYAPIVSPTFTGVVTLGQDGASGLQAVTYQQLQSAILGQNYKEAVKYATTAALPAAIYNNGSGTLTGVSVGAISTDSGSPSVGDRLLVKNQVSNFQNGWYIVTATGSGIAVFVLTRTTDANLSAEFKTGDSSFVTSGTTLSTTTWVYIGIDNPVIGTDAITFTQVAGPGSFISGNGITITGTTIAIDTSVTADKTTAQTLTNKTLIAPVYTGILSTGTLGYSPAANVLASFQSLVNSYNQVIIQNTSSGTTASSDFIANNDLSTDLTYYGDFGMNSSGFTGSSLFNVPNAVYLSATSGPLMIGTTTAHGINFVINNGTTAAMTISSAGLVTIPSPTISGHPIIEGVTSTGATGTGKFVFDTSPTLSGPVVGTQSANDNSTKAASTAYVDTTSSKVLRPANNLSDVSNYLTSRNNINLYELFLIAGDQTTTASTAQAITELVSGTLPANSRWLFMVNLRTGCGNTGGVKWAATIPSGATMSLSHSGTLTPGTSNNAGDTQSTSNTLNTTAYNNANNSRGFITITGEVNIGATPGTVQFQFASGVNGQTSTIFQLGTFVNYKRIV